MEAPRNTSPKDLPIGVHFAATLLDLDDQIRSSGTLYLVNLEEAGYDCIFELDNPTLLGKLSTGKKVIAVGNFQKNAVEAVESYALGTRPCICFRWADTQP